MILNQPSYSHKDTFGTSLNSMNGHGLQKYIVNTALSGIDRVESLLHRAELSGKISYDEIQCKLGRQRTLPPNEIAKLPPHLKNCSSATHLQFKEGKITVVYNPYRDKQNPQANRFKPSCVITTSDSSPALFLKLLLIEGPLSVSSMEYTVDIHCMDSKAVLDMFYLLRRYFYVEKCKDTFMMGGKFHGWREPRSKNAVYIVTFKGGKLVKIYERGPDFLKKRDAQRRPYWQHNNCDRVRIEYTFRRKSGILRKHGINKLSHLFLSPKFESLLSKQVQFKNFTEKGLLPKDYQDYNMSDSGGNIECFQTEYLAAKRNKVSNLNKYLEDSTRLTPLKKQIHDSLKDADSNWLTDARRNMQLATIV